MINPTEGDQDDSEENYGRHAAVLSSQMERGLIGSNTECAHYPCHHPGQNCTFCFCPLYPCLDPELGEYVTSRRTGGRVWSCQGCLWIHRDDVSGSLFKMMPEVGEHGQAKLLKSRVLLLGAGGLGSPAALYLAAAGVGTLGLVDADTVDASNLQRQILHATSRLGMPKVESAQKTIADLNPDVKVVSYKERLTSENVDRILSGEGTGGPWEAIVDGCDNFPTRYLVNDASLFHKIPVVHGSIFRFDGQVITFKPFEGPCYRCMYPEPPPPHLAPSCQEAGVLGILPGVVGVVQATEAIKLLLGKGNPLVGRLLTYDSMNMKFRELKVRRDPHCPACGPNPTIKGYIDYEGFCARG